MLNSFVSFALSPVGAGVCITVVGILFALGIALRAAFATTRTPNHSSEEYYLSPTSSDEGKFPSILENPTKYISLIIPAYNEEERMDIMLDEMFEHLEEQQRQNKEFTYELILVDDGSKDKTVSKALDYVKRYGTDIMRILKLHKNHGKGGAVRKGMLRARGKYLLMVDADGATKASELVNVLNALRKVETNGLGIGVGSRAHLEDESKAKRNPFRKLLMWGFHTLVTVLVGGEHNVRDTQCGFKMFTRETAARLFSVMHIERWAFDVEILFLAAKWGDIPIVEVPVQWHEVDGSKLDVVSSTIQMARDLLTIRLCYMFGLWSRTDVFDKQYSMSKKAL